ncbi:HNH endonuclease [Candidatus Uhrbacteria bacterium]|nr:HNH endonuclease [Candidatus Uhrbacteria bacterium]
MNKKIIFIMLVAGFILACYGMAIYQSGQQIKKLHRLAQTAGPLGQRNKSQNCQVRGSMPDPDCTPGAIFPEATKQEVCTSGYSKKVRKVSTKTKSQVYTSYGVTSHKTGEYEVDHFISLELGGSNEMANLFPEAAEPKPGFHQKDEIENYLHEQLCAGHISLKEAQALIGQKWLEVYRLLHLNFGQTLVEYFKP